MKNPLLDTEKLPRFASINPDHIEPAIESLLMANRKQLELLLKNTVHYTWDNLIQTLEDMDDKLERAWSIVNHLHAVADNKELRKVYNACLPKLSDYDVEIRQNEKLFHAYKYITQQTHYESLTNPQKKLIQNTLRDFHLSGIGLHQKKKARYKTIQQELSKLQTKFEENLLDATHAWKKLVTDKKQLLGLPESALALAQQAAQNHGKKGWLFTLDLPSYYPVMQYADNTSLRKEMYEAYVTRASEQGPDAGKWDNSEIMVKILHYRTKKAKLLGFKSYAHYSLANKMAESPEAVMHFLNNLVKRSREHAKKEFAELVKFAKKTANVEKLEASDILYFSEKLRQSKFNISQETLRPYFSINRVLAGLFTITKKLYGIHIKQRHNVETWHKDVCFFDLFDQKETLRGSFYLDLYARQNKQDGAWMDECIARRKNKAEIQHPVAYLTCNLTPPIGDNLALITHDELITLFHEFGHVLHHLLTMIEYRGISGINGVPWDAVELPSQFMENWCWKKEALNLFACHIETKEPIDDELFEKMTHIRTFQSGMQMVKQLEFAIFDFCLHLESSTDSSLDIQAILDEVRRQVAIVPVSDFNRFQHSFSHIFSGGYAGGYYSYKWAEVLSSDAFSKFEEKGIFDKTTGKEFLEIILEQGGSRDPMDLFVEFRGRNPSIEPLLNYSGITQSHT